MIQIDYTNIKRHDNLEFDNYLKLEGLSHSYLKMVRDGIKEDMIVTQKMRLGSLVDDIMTNPKKANMSHENFQKALRISQVINEKFGDNIKFMTPQVSFEGDVTFNGLTIHSTGRLDWLLGRHAVLDLKVTHEAKTNLDFINLIEWMGYDNQLRHYGRFAKVRKHFILIYSTKIQDARLFSRLDSQQDIDKADEWWANKISEHGLI